MKLLATVGALVIATLASATPKQMQTFILTLKSKESSRLSKAQCITCHTEGAEYNAFGADLNSALLSSGKKLINADVLRMIAMKDSDGDGWRNQDELSRDTLPGDPRSHPAGMPPGQTDHKFMMGADMNQGGLKTFLDRPLPKHFVHSFILHFPMALFMVGIGLELFGLRRKSVGLRRSGWKFLLLGSVGTALVVPIELMLFLGSGFHWSGNPLTHIIFTVIAITLTFGTVIWRRKAEYKSVAYFVSLVLALVSIGLAGHFGGQLISGN